MKNGEIQADRVFPIPEPLLLEKDWREQLRQDRCGKRGKDWIRPDPLEKFKWLPMPLRILVETIVYTVLLIFLMGYLIWYTSRKDRKSVV